MNKREIYLSVEVIEVWNWVFIKDYVEDILLKIKGVGDDRWNVIWIY